MALDDELLNAPRATPAQIAADKAKEKEKPAKKAAAKKPPTKPGAGGKRLTKKQLDAIAEEITNSPSAAAMSLLPGKHYNIPADALEAAGIDPAWKGTFTVPEKSEPGLPPAADKGVSIAPQGQESTPHKWSAARAAKVAQADAAPAPAKKAAAKKAAVVTPGPEVDPVEAAAEKQATTGPPKAKAASTGTDYAFPDTSTTPKKKASAPGLEPVGDGGVQMRPSAAPAEAVEGYASPPTQVEPGPMELVNDKGGEEIGRQGSKWVDSSGTPLSPGTQRRANAVAQQGRQAIDQYATQLGDIPATLGNPADLDTLMAGRREAALASGSLPQTHTPAAGYTVGARSAAGEPIPVAKVPAARGTSDLHAIDQMLAAEAAAAGTPRPVYGPPDTRPTFGPERPAVLPARPAGVAGADFSGLTPPGPFNPGFGDALADPHSLSSPPTTPPASWGTPAPFNPQRHGLSAAGAEAQLLGTDTRPMFGPEPPAGFFPRDTRAPVHGPEVPAGFYPRNPGQAAAAATPIDATGAEALGSKVDNARSGGRLKGLLDKGKSKIGMGGAAEAEAAAAEKGLVAKMGGAKGLLNKGMGAMMMGQIVTPTVSDFFDDGSLADNLVEGASRGATVGMLGGGMGALVGGGIGALTNALTGGGASKAWDNNDLLGGFLGSSPERREAKQMGQQYGGMVGLAGSDAADVQNRMQQAAFLQQLGIDPTAASAQAFAGTKAGDILNKYYASGDSGGVDMSPAGQEGLMLQQAMAPWVTAQRDQTVNAWNQQMGLPMSPQLRADMSVLAPLAQANANQQAAGTMWQAMYAPYMRDQYSQLANARLAQQYGGSGQGDFSALLNQTLLGG